MYNTFGKTAKSTRRSEIIALIDIVVMLLGVAAFIVALASLVEMVEALSFDGAPLKAFLVSGGYLGVLAVWGWLINR